MSFKDNGATAEYGIKNPFSERLITNFSG